MQENNLKDNTNVASAQGMIKEKVYNNLEDNINVASAQGTIKEKVYIINTVEYHENLLHITTDNA